MRALQRLKASAVGDSARIEELVELIYLFFRACAPDPGDRCLGVVRQGRVEGRRWSDVDIGVVELGARSRADDGS